MYDIHVLCNYAKCVGNYLYDVFGPNAQLGISQTLRLSYIIFKYTKLCSFTSCVIKSSKKYNSHVSIQNHAISLAYSKTVA